MTADQGDAILHILSKIEGDIERLWSTIDDLKRVQTEQRLVGRIMRWGSEMVLVGGIGWFVMEWMSRQ